jgi:quercetin dioxygenase-like cupin family protein
MSGIVVPPILLTAIEADSITRPLVCYSTIVGFIFECDMTQQVQWFRWDDMPREQVSDTIDRRIITGDRMMLTHVYLKKGCVVPQHSHDNEQLTYILEGALKFWIGDNEEEEITVRTGEVLVIPSNVKHKAEALEDTLDVDVFCPPREDWLNKTDDYLRQK